MGRPNKEQREAAAQQAAWDKAVRDAAYERVRLALERSGMACSDLGGLVALIPTPDGDPVHYFVRLTEVRR
jgi:hypothetical protein